MTNQLVSRRHTQTRTATRDDVRPKAIDLFAGPGGLSLGLEMAGFEVIGAIELDKAAGDTYRRNFDHPSKQRDITTYQPKEFRDYLEEVGQLQEDESIDLVAGGPPCPGFSLIGRSKIADLIKKGEYGDSKEFRHRFIDDPRNELFREFVKYVDEFQPSYFVMENVSGMTSYQIDDDPIVDVIKGSFDGYEVRYKILNSSNFGVPQDRKRIIFLGNKTGLPEAKWPEHSDAEIKTAGEAIADLSDVLLSKDGKTLYKLDDSANFLKIYRYDTATGEQIGGAASTGQRYLNLGFDSWDASPDATIFALADGPLVKLHDPVPALFVHADEPAVFTSDFIQVWPGNF